MRTALHREIGMPLLDHLCSRYFLYLVLFTLSLLTVAACATKRASITTHQATVDLSLLQTLPEEKISYDAMVSPVPERLYIDAKSTEEWRDKGFQ
jgi:hypothetical protein